MWRLIKTHFLSTLNIFAIGVTKYYLVLELLKIYNSKILTNQGKVLFIFDQDWIGFCWFSYIYISVSCPNELISVVFHSLLYHLNNFFPMLARFSLIKTWLVPLIEKIFKSACWRDICLLYSSLRILWFINRTIIEGGIGGVLFDITFWGLEHLGFACNLWEVEIWSRVIFMFIIFATLITILFVFSFSLTNIPAISRFCFCSYHSNESIFFFSSFLWISNFLNVDFNIFISSWFLLITIIYSAITTKSFDSQHPN